MTADVTITLSLCATVLLLAALAFRFPWNKVLSASSQAQLQRLQELDATLEGIRRSVNKTTDELDRQVGRLTHDVELMRVEFAVQVQQLKEEKSSLAEMVGRSRR